MDLYESRLWIADLEETIAENSFVGKLAGMSVLITGCTGLICSAVIDVLIRWNVTHNEKINIIAAGRNKNKFIERFYPYYKEKWLYFVQYDALSSYINIDIPCDYIIHGAGNASPNKIMREPVETMVSNFTGTKLLLDYAKEAQTKRLLYISSSEIYGEIEGDLPHKENEYGYIDLLNFRNSYSEGKRAAETLCISYFTEYNVEAVIIRPGHIYGPTASENDNRVSSQWAYAAARGEKIIMKSAGDQLRSYCYCLDSASAILTVLLKGENCKAYNISSKTSVISIKDLANIISNSAGVELCYHLPTDADIKASNPMHNSSLDATSLLSIGWKALFSAERGLGHTVEILKNILTE